MRKHTTITVRGDENYTRACSALAAAKGIKIGDFVRAALDEKYGSELNDLAVLFVVNADRLISQPAVQSAIAPSPAPKGPAR
jgi:hypothetical protein